MSQLLVNKISVVRQKQALVGVGRGIAAVVGAAVLLISLTMILDWLLDLPWGVRAAFLAVTVAALTCIVLYLVVLPIAFGPDDEELALLVERETPQFSSRLISSIQLSEPGAIPAGVSQSIVRAMVRQTEQLAEPMNFGQVVKIDQMLKLGGIAGMILLLGVSIFAYGGEVTGDLLSRAFLSNIPVPRNTKIDYITGSQKIPLGDSITIEVAASRVIPSGGKIELKYKSGREQVFTMDRIADEEGKRPNRFVRTIENVQDSFTYRVFLNDARSEKHTIQALPRPSVVSAAFEVVYPRYTYRAPELKTSAELSILAGSSLNVAVRTNKPIDSALVKMHGLAQEVPMKVGGAGSDELTSTVRVPDKAFAGMSFILTDQDGVTSRGETVYPVEVVPDKEPTVRILHPMQREETVTQKGTIRIVFEAADEYGVDRARLWYKLDTEEDESALPIDLDIKGNVIIQSLTGQGSVATAVTMNRHLFRTGQEITIAGADQAAFNGAYTITVLDSNTFTYSMNTAPTIATATGKLIASDDRATIEERKKFRRRFDFDLKTLPRTPELATTIEYWIEVIDANDVSQPGRGVSERYKAKMVTVNEKTVEIMSKLEDGMRDLGRVEETQRLLSAKLVTTID